MKLEKEFVIRPDVDGLAHRLRKLYAEHKTEQMGHVYRPAPRFNSLELWYAVADKCIELNADPVDFVKSAFTYCVVPGGPFPQNMASRAMDRWYGDLTRLAPPEPESGLTSADVSLRSNMMQVSIIAMRGLMANGWTLESTLLSPYRISPELCPPYMRVCLLPESQAVRDKWLADAKAELQTNPALVKSLTRLGINLDGFK
jgi:hypothetical protein